MYNAKRLTLPEQFPRNKKDVSDDKRIEADNILKSVSDIDVKQQPEETMENTGWCKYTVEMFSIH